MVKSKYSDLSELQFVKIDESYREQIDDFQTWEKDLLAFLKEDAVKNQTSAINSTYLIFDKDDFSKKNQQLLGYVTIFADSINLDGSLKRIFQEKGINYKSLPAMKIGRLCVDDRFQGKGIGKFILAECIRKACCLNEDTACRFITLDAKRNADKGKDSLHFYRRFGFEVLAHKNKNKDEMMKITSGTTPMYLDLIKIIQEGVTKK